METPPPLPPLTPDEVRVLGSLIEKAVTTPAYYPLTLNSLTLACNQLTNRDPVVSYHEADVLRAIELLREKRLAAVFHGADSRVPKYKHLLTDVIPLTPAELALLCVLLLRGPQTVGELRTRTERLHPFADLAEIEETLQALAARQPHPLVAKLPRQPGLKESRYTHLLSGPVELPTPSESALRPASGEHSQTEPVRRPTPPATPAENERFAKLEAETAALRRELGELTQQFADFRKQLE